MRNQYNFDPFFEQPRQMPMTDLNMNYESGNMMNQNIINERNMPNSFVNVATNMMPNMNMNLNNQQNLTMPQRLANPEEGYTQGNLFNNLYTPYKNYRPMRLVPNNEQAEMLLRANQLLFASHELRLFLDNYPEDARMIALFNQYRAGANQAVAAYEAKYGPISWDALSKPNLFSWQATEWPWEMGVM